jgi:hypothetical protein
VTGVQSLKNMRTPTQFYDMEVTTFLCVFSYDDYIMENTNEPWFERFYCSCIKSAGGSSYPNHHKEINYSTENITSFPVRVFMSVSPSVTALGVTVGNIAAWLPL